MLDINDLARLDAVQLTRSVMEIAKDFLSALWSEMDHANGEEVVENRCDKLSGDGRRCMLAHEHNSDHMYTPKFSNGMKVVNEQVILVTQRWYPFAASMIIRNGKGGIISSVLLRSSDLLLLKVPSNGRWLLDGKKLKYFIEEVFLLINLRKGKRFAAI